MLLESKNESPTEETGNFETAGQNPVEVTPVTDMPEEEKTEQ